MKHLADKLQHLTNTAETIKKRMMQSCNTRANLETNSRTQSNIPPKVPSFIDLDSALPPSGASSNQNLHSSVQESSKGSPPWNKSSAQPTNKR